MNINSVTQSLRLREYYYMLLRHKLVVFLSAILCLTASVLMALSMPKIYRAEMVLMTEGDNILNPLISGLAITPSAQARMRTLREQMLSWPRLTLLAEKMGLDKEIKNPLQYEGMIGNLRNNIAIRMRGNGIISVGFEGSDPKKAQDITKVLGEIITDGTITSTNLETNSAIQFLDEQLDEYRNKLEESETNLREFQELYNYTLPVATRMNEQLVALKLELQNLLVSNTEKHPRVQQTRQLITQLEDQRNQQMQAAKEAGLDVNNTDYAHLISSVPLQEQTLARLKRDYNVSAELYQKLLQRLETAKLSQTLELKDKGLNFKVLEPARLPLRPVKPNKPLIMLAGLACGLGLGVILVWIIELANNSIRNVEEARRLLDFPIFGSISTIKVEELMLGERLRAEAGV